MANNDILDDLGDAKKYLEEVMGIVEDEEFNRERRRKLRLGQQQEKKQTVNVHGEDNESQDLFNQWEGYEHITSVWNFERIFSPP